MRLCVSRVPFIQAAIAFARSSLGSRTPWAASCFPEREKDNPDACGTFLMFGVPNIVTCPQQQKRTEKERERERGSEREGQRDRKIVRRDNGAKTRNYGH